MGDELSDYILGYLNNLDFLDDLSGAVSDATENLSTDLTQTNTETNNFHNGAEMPPIPVTQTSEHICIDLRVNRNFI